MHILYVNFDTPQKKKKIVVDLELQTSSWEVKSRMKTMTTTFNSPNSLSQFSAFYLKFLYMGIHLYINPTSLLQSHIICI